ncbi:AAA family ATPase [Pantoea ananatis]|uniref:AAA family ATPase n=1 Tax=Pantoea ananas TaxID=553 RepID=UPI001C8A69B9|nr:AAA family ATPase [Pantoea ananatis]QZE31111.1 ATP-binding protein [Pantoea ananatis]
MEGKVNISIPSPNIGQEGVSIDAGKALFILGANGAGKSSLIYHMLRTNITGSNFISISAHRQIWIDSEVVDMSNSEFSQVIEHHSGFLKYNENSRWVDNDPRRSKLSIVRLRKAINLRNRDVAKVVDSGNLANIGDVRVSPLVLINSILSSSGMPITLEVNDDDNITVLNLSYNPPASYSIAQLSDGEKNAISITADIISAPAKTIFVIDEPERHLHRSISSPLLSELISIRPDCFFVISTHDIGLATDMGESKILLVKSCEYSGGKPTSWDVELINEPALIPENIKKDIIGAREKVIFIEGINTSLDIGLYKSLFPKISLIPKEGCEDVAISVRGIRKNASLGWINAFGLVDNDNKKMEEIESLKSDLIFTLKFHSIESIFYHPKMIRIFFETYKTIFEIDDLALNSIKNDIIAVLSSPEKKKDLCSLAVNKAVRWSVNQQIPSHRDGFVNKEITVNAGDLYNEELAFYESAIQSNDVEKLIERYSIRRTGIVDKITRRLNCNTRGLYEAKVMALVRDNPDARDFVIGCLDGLYELVNQ